MEKRYLALPRGVNISGKNKVPMAELRQGLEALGLAGAGAKESLTP